MRPCGAPLALCACNLSPFTPLGAHRAKPACVWNSLARCSGARLSQALRHGLALCEGLATRRLSGAVVGVCGRKWGDWLGAWLGGVA